MKSIITLFLVITSFATWANADFKVQFPQDNGRFLLGVLADEQGSGIEKESMNRRGQAFCEYLGYKKLVKISVTYMGVPLLKVYDISGDKIIAKDLRQGGKYLYSYHHAVINNLECSNTDSYALDKSIEDSGREIAAEKGFVSIHQNQKSKKASKQ